ncbi:MAG: hypothetical protein Q9208_007502 [Pyrenodesmia sp. 3 TL-2023]
MSAFSEIFLATMKEIKTLTEATKYLPSKDAAYFLIIASIEKSCSSLGEQYSNAIDEQELSHNEHSRLIDLYGSLDGIDSAKSVLKIILDCEIQKTNGSGTEEQGDRGDIQVRQCLLDIWGSLQSEKFDKNEVEKAALLALFTQGRVIKKGDTKPEGPAWSVPLASILFPDKSLRCSDLSVTHDLAREILIVQSEKRLPGMDESALEIETRRLSIIQHSPSEKHIRLQYRGLGDGIFDFRMDKAVDGGKFMDKLKLICPRNCEILEVPQSVGLPQKMGIRDRSLRRKRGFELISE